MKKKETKVASETTAIMGNEIGANRPDVMYANRIKAIFDDDPQVDVVFQMPEGEEHGKCIVTVNNETKAAAIRKLLKPCYESALPLDVEVVDGTDITKVTIENAFMGNPHFQEYRDIPTINPSQFFHVCIFNEEVIKFPNDNGGSLHGYEFRIMEDLAREITVNNELQPILYTTDDGIPRP